MHITGGMSLKKNKYIAEMTWNDFKEEFNSSSILHHCWIVRSMNSLIFDKET